ncbi:MAG: hypothetical protein HN584_00390 [Akkermansiaceae bacterium]|nr:hypothetical protein [Akkermansiaceae bacterium]
MSSTKEISKNNSAQVWLFSAIGVVLVFGIVLALNLIVSTNVPFKIDLTEDKIHTLSQGTKDVIEGLDTPVTMSFFVSKDKDNMRPELIPFAKRVDSLLKEYERGSSGGFIEIERVDPSPDSEEEDRAKLNNLQGIPGRLNEPAYLGLTITCLDRKSSIPFIDPNREQMLEYDISRAIVEVTREGAPKVGLMSALPVQGGPATPFAQPGQGQQNRPWQFYTQLKRDYDPDPTDIGSNLVDLGLDIEEVPGDVDVVLLVHPAGISENAQFALDQFLLRGGNIVAFLDSFSVVAAQSQPQRQQFGGAPQAPGIPTSSDLEKLLNAWGVNFEANQVLADTTYATAQTQASNNPAVLTITREAINKDDTLTTSIRDLLMYFSGVFYVSEKEGVKVETLIKSSAKSQLVVPQSVQFNPDQVTQNFKASGKEYPLALRLSGKFTTAFPEGKPSLEEEEEEEEEEKEKEKEEDSLKESKEVGKGSVFLAADSDMLFDALAVGRDLFGRTTYRNNNIPLLENAVDQASGGGSLMSIRTRGSGRRPFSKFKELAEEASEKLNKEIAKVTKTEQEVASEISKLMQEQDNDQMVVLSPEVADKIKQLRLDEVAASKKRRELSRDLRKDIRKIENKIKNLNIAGVPIFIILIGIAHLIIRRVKISAR